MAAVHGFAVVIAIRTTKQITVFAITVFVVVALAIAVFINAVSTPRFRPDCGAVGIVTVGS